MDPALTEFTSYMRQNPSKKIKPTKHIYKVKQIDTHMNNRDRNTKRHCV